MTTSTKESQKPKQPAQLVSFVAGVDLMDPEVPLEVKRAALREDSRDPVGAMAKNPDWYQALVKKHQFDDGSL